MIGPYQVQPLRARVDQGAMAMKGWSTFSKFHDDWNLTIRLFSVLSWTLVGGGLIPLLRSTRCILQHQSIGQYMCVYIYIYIYIHVCVRVCVCVCVSTRILSLKHRRTYIVRRRCTCAMTPPALNMDVHVEKRMITKTRVV